jgi:hypothetical protein
MILKKSNERLLKFDFSGLRQRFFFTFDRPFLFFTAKLNL